jgi:hypothetical protein
MMNQVNAQSILVSKSSLAIAMSKASAGFLWLFFSLIVQNNKIGCRQIFYHFKVFVDHKG